MPETLWLNMCVCVCVWGVDVLLGSKVVQISAAFGKSDLSKKSVEGLKGEAESSPVPVQNFQFDD